VRYLERIIVVCLAACTAVAAGDGATLDIQGHRGARGLRPENTIPAFERAIELGVTTLELDLQVTRDRVVIVSHDQQPDPTLCRDDTGHKPPKIPFSELDHADLATVDCGSSQASGYPEQQTVPGARIPTLQQVLRLARAADYPVRVSVEIKLQHAGMAIPVDEFAKLVVGLLRAEQMDDRAIIQSFDPEALRAVAAIAPEIPRSILVRKRSRYDSSLEAADATILSPKHGALREADVRRLQARGIAVIPWTVNRPADIRRVLALGVDGIISDYPDRVIAIRDK
jgi:glycerophosphoryl diester phosphodiesterase